MSFLRAGAATNSHALVKVPEHVGIIMDGNGRWARRRGLPRIAGHRAGTNNIRQVLEAAADFGIKIVTIYAFSTENWQRPADEVNGLLSIFHEVIGRELESLHKNGVKLRHVGRLEEMPPDLVESITRAVELTKDNTRITLSVAFNYGGRAEIVDAAKQLLRERVDPDSLTEEEFARRLYTTGQPDPDLIIRTGGDMRLSNFLIWQASYAEYYSTPTCWPDFDKKALLEALKTYQSRDRRFGQVNKNLG